MGFMANHSLATSNVADRSNTLVCASSVSNRLATIGPMVDDGAPYSSLRKVELCFHQMRLIGGAMSFEETPTELGGCEFWQFDLGNYASPRRRILGSVLYTLLPTQGAESQFGT